MDHNRPDDPAPTPDSGRPKRAPPTIDLEASEVTTPSESASGTGGAKQFSRPFSWPSIDSISPSLVAAITGAIAAVLVMAGAWAIGWPAQTPAPTANAESNAGTVDALTSRITELETRAAKPVSPTMDPALSGRFDALEKSLATLRAEITTARAKSDKLAAELDAVKSAPGSSAAAPASSDIAEIEQRLSQIERASRADSDRIEQAAAKPADDTALRRLAVASLLDISVRQGEPYAAALAAAKALASDPQPLKPLEAFAASGVPTPASLCRELLTLVPKLSPPAPETTAGTGIVDRLKTGAAKLVRIERSDVTGNDRSAIVARVTAAALRNDVRDTERELKTLSPAEREPAQAWLDKTGERDAALAASHRFAADAMATLAKPGP
jgi:hypothetical protein